jgi:hypothetical protein
LPQTQHLPLRHQPPPSLRHLKQPLRQHPLRLLLRHLQLLLPQHPRQLLQLLLVLIELFRFVDKVLQI